jgi:hypothetical protein
VEHQRDRPVTFPAHLAAFHPVVVGPVLRVVVEPVRLVADQERLAAVLALDSSARQRRAAHSPAAAAVVDPASAVVEQRQSTR